VSDQAKAAEPLLEMSTLAPARPTVKIDDELYELRLLQHDFSADEHARFRTDLDEFETLWDEEKRSKSKAQRMSMLLKRLVNQVVIDLPAAVERKLSDEQKRSLVVTFQYAPALAEAMARNQKTAKN
jgi:hypothetical protein